MSRRKRAARAPSTGQSGPSGPSGFLATIGLGIFAILALAFGLILVAVFWKVAIDEMKTWWQVIVAVAVASGFSAVGLCLVAGVAWYLGGMATGWLGIFSGQVPEAFAPDGSSVPAAVGSLVLAAGGIGLGMVVYRHGVDREQLNWALMGLFLAASAGLIGLGGAVPLLYFQRRGARMPRAALAPDGVIAFLVAAALGIGVSVGISMSRAERAPVPRSRTLEPWQWVKGCLGDPAISGCTDRVELGFTADRPGMYRIDLRGGCSTMALVGADGRTLPSAGWPEFRRLGLDPYEAKTQTVMKLLRLGAGQRTRIDLTRQPHLRQSCLYRLRYLQVSP